MKHHIEPLATWAVATAVGLGLSSAFLGQLSQARATQTAGQLTPTLIDQPQAPILFQAVVAPLNSLRLMKRALISNSNAASPFNDLPLLAILNEPLKTTGLGPIHIGMTLAELEATGLTPLAIEGSGQDTCQYYRIKGNSEPISLMAVDGRILRIDVWPGSLIETRSGIRLGSTEADIVRLYGHSQLEATANPVTLGKTIVFTPRDPGEDLFRLVFETDDRGQVVQYRAGQFPSVTWSGGCL